MNPEENLKNNIQEKNPEERIPIKSLRTYQGDVQEAIEKNKYSSTTILVSEQKRKLENPVEEFSLQKSKDRNKNFIIFGVAFIVLGLASVSALYYIKSNEKIEIEQRTKALIAFSEEKTIPITNLNRKEFVVKFLENKKSWNTPVNSVLYLNLLSLGGTAPIKNVLSIVGPDMPPSLVRSFGNEYMFGIYSFDTNEAFLILKIDDFSLAYPGMLKWENDMALNLGEFFNIPNNQNTSSSPLVFIDKTSKNRDIRVLKDTSGNDLLLYSFIDKKTLVITKNENILSAIVGKLIVSKQVR